MSDLDVVRVSVSAVLLGLVIVGNARLLSYSRHSISGSSTLRIVLPILAGSCLLAGISGFSGLLMSSWKDGPLNGKLSCEVFGTFDHVFAGGANWMLAIVSLERYIQYRTPTEHSSTFSSRNLKILVAGMYILQVMIAVGPFYGLGEYSVFRGKLPLVVSLNSSDTVSLKDSMSKLRITFFKLMEKVPDATYTVGRYLASTHRMVVARTRWLDDGILFLMRVPNGTVAASLWQSYSDGSVNDRIASLVFSPRVKYVLGKEFPNTVTYINPVEYGLLNRSYLPAQDLGVCDADFTSVNEHSDIWMAYNVLLTALVPCAVATICCSAICFSFVRLGDAADKSVLPDDIFFSKALAIVSWLASASHVTFMSVYISFARGTHFSPTTLLGILYLVHLNRLSLYICWCLVDGTPCKVAVSIGVSCLRVFIKARGVLRSDTSGGNRPCPSQIPSPVSL